MYLPWVTVPPGPIGDLRNQPLHQPYNRCSRWPVAWETRCARSPDKRTPPNCLREIERSQIRIVDSALRHGPVGTIPESSASAVDSLDTCRPAAHDRTLPYHSNLWVGNSNLIIVNNGMAITNRETPHRPGPHPHRATRTSFEPHVIVIHRIKFILLTTGHCDQLYSSTTEFMYRKILSTADRDQVESQEVPSHNIMDGTSVSHTVLRTTPLDQNHPQLATRPVGRSVIWSYSVDDQPDEEAVMQISGTGHWFLEGWIGDHAVDFLVDSGSAVTAVSCLFYKTLMEAGAPVGELRPTARKLRGANGSQIDILECSSCVVSFLGLHTHWTSSMDCCLRRVACPIRYTTGTLHSACDEPTVPFIL